MHLSVLVRMYHGVENIPMINGNPEFADLVYDFIKSRHRSASKWINYSLENAVDIFIDGQLVCTVYADKLYCGRFGRYIIPTDPHLFDKITLICSGRI